MLGFGELVDADDLRGAGGIGGGELVSGADAAAADDEVVLVAEFGGDFGEGGFHGSLVVAVGEVVEGLVEEGREGGEAVSRCHGS